MVKLWNSISHLGLQPAMGELQRRTVLFTNRLAVILFILNALAAAAVVLVYTWAPIVWLILANNLVYASVLLLNRSGSVNGSRFLLSLYFPLSTLAITLISKLTSPGVDEFSFFSSRVVMLVASILPLILFQLTEKKFLYVSLLITTVCLLFYDLIHHLAGVSYYQLGFYSDGYLFFNLVMVLLYVLLVSGFWYYKNMLERAEHELGESHEQLKHFFAELGMQHEEIHAQADQLMESQQQLQQAHDLIEQQRALLEAENVELYQHLLEKNNILEASNQELHHRLEELRQFSYTISHNLRGPVANLLGLTALFNYEEATAKNRELMLHTRTAANALDAVIRDLSGVLQLRDAKESTETINLEYLLRNVLVSLKAEMQASHIHIEEALNIKEIQGVKPYLHSILYNLLSNAFKYADPERKGHIRISSERSENGVLLKIKDNGLGIDLEKHGKNLFKMYKRFHEFREGRGLGLYLIKTQAELLGGSVEVKSKPGKGSTFKVWLPQASCTPEKTLSEH